MHTYITGIIRNLLADNDFPQQVISKYEVPDDGTDRFVRLFWSYGDSSFYSNNMASASDILIFEIYERKFIPESLIDDFILGLRKELLKFKSFKYSGKVGLVTNISLIENANDEMWKSYSLTLPITFFEEEAE